MTAWLWLPLAISWATSIALGAWAVSLNRQLVAAEEERDRLWDAQACAPRTHL